MWWVLWLYINHQKNIFFYYHENKCVREKSTRVYFQRAVDMIRQKRKHCCNPYKNKNRTWILRDFTLDTNKNTVKPHLSGRPWNVNTSFIGIWRGSPLPPTVSWWVAMTLVVCWHLVMVMYISCNVFANCVHLFGFSWW